jgi:CheY-like chemotaxis protein
VSRERPVARVVAQVGLLTTSASLSLTEPDDARTPVATIDVVDGRIAGAHGADVRALLARESPVLAAPWVVAADEDLDLDLDIVDETDGSAVAMSAASRSEARARLPPPRVLVVDVDRDALRLATLALARHGLEVTTTPDARRAVERIAAERPDVVVVDLGAKLEGWEMLGRLRLSARARETPVILVGWNEGQLARLQAAGCGAAVVVEKSLPPGRIAAAVAEVCAPVRDLTVDVTAGALDLAGRFVGFGPFRLLRLLATARFTGRVDLASDGGPASFTLVDGGLAGVVAHVGGLALDERTALVRLLRVDVTHYALRRGGAAGAGADLGALLDDVVAEHEALADEAFAAAIADGSLQARPGLLALYRELGPADAGPVVDQLVAGRPVRDVLADGVDPLLLDRVLRDLFTRGALRPS